MTTLVHCLRRSELSFRVRTIGVQFSQDFFFDLGGLYASQS